MPDLHLGVPLPAREQPRRAHGALGKLRAHRCCARDVCGAHLAGTSRPFNPATTLRLNLPAAGSVTLRVLDVAGRRVVSILDGVSLPAGETRLQWQAENDHGHALPSGVYFADLQVAGESRKLKLLLLK
ncbi:MAG: FlgD immunoglobulin-like domain containing protein [Candidatus Krumholzibacteriia bacterium]